MTGKCSHKGHFYIKFKKLHVMCVIFNDYVTMVMNLEVKMTFNPLLHRYSF